MSEGRPTEIEVLRVDVADLTRRVAALETFVALGAHEAPRTAPERPAPAAAAPQAAPAADRPPAPARIAAPPARPALPPIDWRRAWEALFTARTLAWAGGVATTLGVVLLFVMAASRGWVTPPMRVGLGVGVSLLLLAAAVELDRRSWRSDAILAAAGTGIAGLYACLWASTSLYGWIGQPAALPLAGAVAALAVAVAIRIRQEPLAVFGIAAAMLAPLLVSLDVTAGGVLFAFVIATAAVPLHLRLGWRMVAGAAWLVGLLEAAALALALGAGAGAGLGALDIALFTGLFVVMLFLSELRAAPRGRISSAGWTLASSAFTLSLAASFVVGGGREVAGHSLAGIVLAGVGAGWALLAALPWALRRPHADLADLLAGFALACAATATGLLAGGPALVCAWAAESALLIALAERIAGRGGGRRLRLTIAAAAYLALAAAAAWTIVVPTPDHLPALGEGSSQGSIALAAIALAGVVLCYGVRWLDMPELTSLWTLPAVAVAYLPVWALAPVRAVAAYAALAAALLALRRSRFMVAWLRDDAAVAIGAGWWALGALVALAVASPVEALQQHGLGARDGLPGLVALLASAGVLAWSLRRPRRPGVDQALLLVAASLAYLIAEALPAPAAVWAWVAAGAAVAMLVHLPAVRRRAGEQPLLASAALLVGTGVVGAWQLDGSLQAFLEHGRGAGWPSIALAVAATAALASAVREPRARSYALWLPAALAAQLAAMLLPGQYPLVAWAALGVAAGGLAAAWPRPLGARLDRRALVELAALGALVTAGLVLAVYETPRMLFVTGHHPAAGLAAALAATVALGVAGLAAARAGDRRVGPVEVWKGLVYAAGAAALWTLAAAILGAGQILLAHPSSAAVHDRFQQGHVLVSIGWVLVGLALAAASLRGDRRRLRYGATALLFVALGKLFLYDLAFLTAMARAVSFIATGSALLAAALILQRFAPPLRTSP